MPKAGFKSITVNEIVYDKLHQHYKILKNELSLFGINSFAGFVTFSVQTLFENEDVFKAFVDSMDNRQKAVFQNLRKLKHA